MKTAFQIALMLISIRVGAQADINSNTVTWFGLDFSKAKLVGSSGFSDVAKIQSYYFNEWNSVIVSESDKYNISRYFKKTTVNRNLDKVRQRNGNVKVANLVTDNTHHISSEDVAAVTKAYAGTGSGLGLLFVVESFDKTAEQAGIWVTYFDMKNGKVLSTKRTTGKAVGFGFRNYWLGAVANVMKNY